MEIGDKYGYWTVLGFNPQTRRLKVKCKCGNIKKCHVTNVTRGKSKSCGCYRVEMVRERSPLHIITNTKPYYAYRNMLNRCYNKKVDSYHLYGERGIGVCKKWKTFEGFWKDMGPSYIHGLSLDRIDNNKGYSKDNCRWVDTYTQANNKRNSRILEFNGEKHTLTQWSRIIGMNKKTLANRYYALKWTVKKCLTTPVPAPIIYRNQYSK